MGRQAMAVRAEGYCWVMEQLGEKQDFESELSRLGYLHASVRPDLDDRCETLGRQLTRFRQVAVQRFRET